MKTKGFVLTILAVLILLSPSIWGQSGTPKAIIVLDASGSMWGQVEGRAKIEIAREVIADLVKKLPSGIELGLITYGHRRKGDCSDIELLIPPGKVDQKAFINAVNSLLPKGMTPLTDAMELAAESLRYTEQAATVIIVTDGLETCDRDPCEAAKKLEKLGIGFTAHVVAFDIKAEDALKIKCISDYTGGRFLPAQDAASLKDALDFTIEEVKLPATAEAPPVVKEDPAVLKVPAEVNAGATFSVEWTGPNGKGDYITILPADQKDDHYGNYTYCKKGSPLKLVALIKPQPAEVRYISGRTRKVLGRAKTLIVPISASLEVPAEATAGSVFKVKWTGPGYKGDYITMVQADADEGVYGNYTYVKDTDGALKLTAIMKAGEAEVRYIAAQGSKTLARAKIKINKAAATITAPEQAVAGSEVKITWTGPANKSDFITIVPKDADEGKYESYQYATDPDVPLKIAATMKPGEAEIRYVSGQGNKTLARRPITITKAEVTLAAIDSVIAGSEVKITWTGPANKSDFITIVPKDTDEGRYESYKYAKDPDVPIKVAAPMKPGEAEIRYVAGKNNKTLARRLIIVTAAKVTLEAPDSVVAGSIVKIKWTGPANKRDFITIVKAGADEGKYEKYAYAKDPDVPVKVKARLQTGPAEIRYVAGKNNKTLASRPIMITESE